ELGYLAGPSGTVRDRLLHTREHDVPAFLDALVADVPWHDVRVVGFSSTFQQNAASFALARRLKQRYPDLVTVFGGANFDGGMGASGGGGWRREGGRGVAGPARPPGGGAAPAPPPVRPPPPPGAAPPGARGGPGGRGPPPPAPPRAALDDLPAPDYAEYFDRAA